MCAHIVLGERAFAAARHWNHKQSVRTSWDIKFVHCSVHLPPISAFQLPATDALKPTRRLSERSMDGEVLWGELVDLRGARRAALLHPALERAH